MCVRWLSGVWGILPLLESWQSMRGEMGRKNQGHWSCIYLQPLGPPADPGGNHLDAAATNTDCFILIAWQDVQQVQCVSMCQIQEWHSSQGHFVKDKPNALLTKMIDYSSSHTGSELLPLSSRKSAPQAANPSIYRSGWCQNSMCKHASILKLYITNTSVITKTLLCCILHHAIGLYMYIYIYLHIYKPRLTNQCTELKILPGQKG